MINKKYLLNDEELDAVAGGNAEQTDVFYAACADYVSGIQN